MIPVTQTRFGETGNCFEACIASIFEKDISDVPDFGAHKDTGEWLRELNAWLMPQGYCYFEGRIPYDDDWDDFFSDKDFYYIAVGPTIRSSEILHAVVGRKGAMVHDPSPDNTGILKEKTGMRFGVFVKCFT